MNHAALASTLAAAPAHWERRRFRFATRLRTTKNTASDLPLLSVSAAHGVRVRDEGGLGRQAPAEETITSYWVVQPGDVVVNPMWVIEGGVAASSLQGAVSPAYRVYTPAPDVDSRYLHHLLRSRPYMEQYRQFIRGVTTFDRSVSKEDFADLPVLLPSLEEQRRIADFLDAETARIDALETRRRRQSDLTRERFESFAESATGRKALRCGMLPDGWSTLQLRRTITSMKTGTTPSSADAELWLPGEQSDAVPWYGPSSVASVLEVALPSKYLPRSALADRIVPRFPSGSVLVVGIGATAGKVAYLDHEGTGNQQITALVPKPGIVGRFLAWQLWAAKEELRELAPYTTLPIINNDFLKTFPLAVPPVTTQQIVTGRIDQAASRLRMLEHTAQQAISLLAERRQALITAAVTGRFDVSTASGRDATEGITA